MILERLLTPDRRYGGIRVGVPRDRFGGDPRLDFATLVIERFEPAVHRWVPMVTSTLNGQAVGMSALIVESGNGEGHRLPMKGDIRVRLVTKKAVATCLDVLLFPDPGVPPALSEPHHSVAFDGEAVQAVGFSFVTSVSLSGGSAKTTAGSNRCGIVHLGMAMDTATESVTSVTWGGSGMTHFITADHVASFSVAKLYYTDFQPGTAGATVTANFDASIAGVIGASSYNGVDQTTRMRAGSGVQATGNTNPSQNVTSPTDDMAVDCVIGTHGVALTSGDDGASQTFLFGLLRDVGADQSVAASYRPGAGTTNMQWNNINNNFAYVAASIQAAEGGGGDPVVLMGQACL